MVLCTCSQCRKKRAVVNGVEQQGCNVSRQTRLTHERRDGLSKLEGTGKSDDETQPAEMAPPSFIRVNFEKGVFCIDLENNVTNNNDSYFSCHPTMLHLCSLAHFTWWS